MRILQIKEYEWIDLESGPAAHLDRLEKKLPLHSVERRRREIRFRGFCGVLQLGNVTLEILPKLSGLFRDAEASRLILIRMLKVVYKLPLNEQDSASLAKQKFTLLDVFISSFCGMIASLANQGLIHKYISRNEDLSRLRGKLNLQNQLRHNVFHLDRLNCLFDEFQIDNDLNQVVKLALSIAAACAVCDHVRTTAHALLGIFKDVSEISPLVIKWEALTLDRRTSAWEPVLLQCRWFIEGWNPDVIAGRENSIGLLFNMSKLFEAYVAVELKRELIIHGIEVLVQKPKKWLLKSQGGRWLFQMKPDIVLLRNGKGLAILDTKWKLLDMTSSKMGISQADLYQMFTYARSYNVDTVALIYPDQDDFESLENTWMFCEGDIKLWILRIDLGELQKGREAFRRKLMQDGIGDLLLDLDKTTYSRQWLIPVI